MSNPLEHALVPVANGKLRSGGEDLIVGEAVKQFWTWPKYIQDMHLKSRKVVMVSAADAVKSMAKAAELRAVSHLKEEKAEISGIEAQLSGVVDLLEALDEQRDQLVDKAKELSEQLETMRASVAEKMADEGMRPEDSESDAVDAKPQNSVEEATGIKPKEESAPEADETVDASPGDDEVDPSPAAELPPETVAQIAEWAKGLTYRELQTQAKHLELKDTRVKHAVLLGLVIEAVVAKELASLSVDEASSGAGEGDDDENGHSSTGDGSDDDDDGDGQAEA